MLQLKIPFGLTADGRMVCVKEVGRGLSCECVCPECGCNLVARKGDVTVHHFAHQPKGTTNLVSCQNGLETSIHRMAKQILSERGGLKIPSIAASHRGLTSTGTEVSITKTTIEEHWISFDNLCLEHRIDPLRPDIVGYRNGKPFIIEVTVSNPIIAAKREVLRALQIPALEINLGNVTYAITRSDLETDIIDDTKKKQWIWHPDLESLRNRVKEEVRVAIEQENRAIDEQDRLRRMEQKAMSEAYRQRRKMRQALRLSSSVDHKRSPCDPMWLLCEYCRHIWRTPRPEPSEGPRTPTLCPACGSNVSRMPPR